jgi:hypothetical protein
MAIMGRYFNDFLSNEDHTEFWVIGRGDLRAGTVCQKPQTVNRVDIFFCCLISICDFGKLDGDNIVDS